MTERMVWRRAVERSRLPNGVKLTLLKHAERGISHYHEEERNQHGFPRALLARRRGIDESTIRRHFRRAEAEGYLTMHEKGDRGQQAGQGRGHQTVFHYVTPSDPWPCDVCGKAGGKGGNAGDAEGRQKGGSYYPLYAPLPGDPVAPPITTPSSTAAVSDNSASHMPVILDEHQQTADQLDPALGSSSRCRFSPSRNAPAAPAPDLALETALGESPTTEGRKPPKCTVCGNRLNAALFAAEPWYDTHPSCDLRDLASGGGRRRYL